jgi:hypothetical protein
LDPLTYVTTEDCQFCSASRGTRSRSTGQALLSSGYRDQEIKVAGVLADTRGFSRDTRELVLARGTHNVAALGGDSTSARLFESSRNAALDDQCEANVLEIFLSPFGVRSG